jgi:TolB-like protein
MNSVLQRLRERKLFQWALAYLAGAWIIFQGIEVMAEPWGLSPGFQRTAHLLVAVGFLVALVLAWYHGEQGRQGVSGAELLIIALLLAVGASLIRMYRPEEAAAPETRQAERPASGAVRSLAVLPLANLMGDPEQAYFVDGLHDVLIGELAGISELTVISRTSVMRYRDTDQPLGSIAAELGVDALVEGSVFRAGDTVRINVQLIRGSPEEHLWQDRYDGRLSEALGLQTRVAEAIAREIRLALSPREAERLARRTEVDPAAHWPTWRKPSLWTRRSRWPGPAWPTRTRWGRTIVRWTYLWTRRTTVGRRARSGQSSWIRTWPRPTPPWVPRACGVPGTWERRNGNCSAPSSLIQASPRPTTGWAMHSSHVRDLRKHSSPSAKHETSTHSQHSCTGMSPGC